MIRPVRYRDIAAINAIHRVSSANHLEWRSSIAPQSWPSTRATLISGLLPARGVHSYVLEEGGQIYGFIQARPRSSADKWDIIRLVAAVDRPADVWLPLLEYLCVAGGNRGARKFFANVPEDAEELEIFRQSGFYRFTSEEALSVQLNGEGGAADMPSSVRPTHPRDAFPILQLYGTIAPRNVQQAEGLTVRDWTPPSGRLNAVLDKAGLAHDSASNSWSFVAEEGGKLFGWFRLRWREGRCRLSFLLLPERRAEFPCLLDFAIGTVRATRPCVLVVQVRDYQQELLPIFDERGFSRDGRYLLLVKNIVVQVMERRLAPVLTRARPASLIPLSSGGGSG
ncbi:MAG: GNAT family N-acetyltransferase [Chloroflexota bacterium]